MIELDLKRRHATNKTMVPWKRTDKTYLGPVLFCVNIQDRKDVVDIEFQTILMHWLITSKYSITTINRSQDTTSYFLIDRILDAMPQLTIEPVIA